MTAIELAEKLYREKGAPMIRAKFPEYEARIAAGIAGEGSDCFGFDDGISRDHDYGAGFCLWLTRADAEKIGGELSDEYLKLIEQAVKEDPSIAPSGYDPRLFARRGVRTIGDFYSSLLHMDIPEKGFVPTDKEWLAFDEEDLAAAVNGAVFYDGAGLFSEIRKTLLKYYPERIWKRRIRHEMRMFSQYAQSNYARSMARGDLLTASICKAKAAEAAMKLAFLLNRRYAPYYKWLHRGVMLLPKLSGVAGQLEKAAALTEQTAAWEAYKYDSTKMNPADKVEAAFEEIAALFARELIRLGLIEDSRGITFLDYLAGMMQAQDRKLEQARAEEKERLIKEIVACEWSQFDKVQNSGGRAGCQDDWETFRIMRTSQYRAWDRAVLDSYLSDLQEAEALGWNLLTEKYARMMEKTDPAGYEALKDRLPVRSEMRLALQEEVIALHVAWNEEMAAKYPLYTGRGRPIHSFEDTPWDTSSETYLRGELSTYSDRTFARYLEMVQKKKAAGENLVETIAKEQALQYGYRSLEDAEEALIIRKDN